MKLMPKCIKKGAGKFISAQARVLWSQEERVHMRPGHHWVAELGDADGEGSPVIKGPFQQQEYFEGLRFDKGDYALLVRRWYNRTPEDRMGLTFMRWEDPQKKKVLIINSSELRAVGFGMALINAPVLRASSARLASGGAAKGRGTKRKRGRGGAAVVEAEPVYGKRQKWHLDQEADAEIREVCECT